MLISQIVTAGALRVERARGTVQTEPVLVASKWTHVAVCFLAEETNASASIYVDGTLRKTGPLPAAGASNPSTGLLEFAVLVPAGQLGASVRTFMAEATTSTAFNSSYIQWQTHWGYSTPFPPTARGEVLYGTFYPRRGLNVPYMIPR
eukprot:tig00000882_g5277.t1